TFPKQSSNFDEISSYLETHANFAFNLSTFDEIWELYLAG
ncbi:MAG: YozE family protein, partial [Lactococcus chungangensis]